MYATTIVESPSSFEAALRATETYVRSKIKKGKRDEVGGPGGKLERLEIKVGDSSATLRTTHNYFGLTIVRASRLSGYLLPHSPQPWFTTLLPHPSAADTAGPGDPGQGKVPAQRRLGTRTRQAELDQGFVEAKQPHQHAHDGTATPGRYRHAVSASADRRGASGDWAVVPQAAQRGRVVLSTGRRE